MIGYRKITNCFIKRISHSFHLLFTRVPATNRHHHLIHVSFLIEPLAELGLELYLFNLYQALQLSMSAIISNVKKEVIAPCW